MVERPPHAQAADPRPSGAQAYEHLIRLVRIARALESCGIMNAAKLFWAAAFSQEIRAAGPQAAAAPDVLDREIGEAIGVLRATGAAPGVIAALERGRVGARESRAIARAEVPEVAVCRECGEILLGLPPEQCPTCGARAATFREIPPVYFLEPLPLQQAIDLLATAADELERIVGELTEMQMAQPPQPGQWSLREVLLHLLQAQGLLAARVPRILDEDDPSLAAVAAWKLDDEETLSASEILRRFRASREATLARLRPLRLEQWFRTGQHDEFGQVTLLQQATYFARHERYHMPRMEATRRIIEAQAAAAAR